jgi:hypothetical protein
VKIWLENAWGKVKAGFGSAWGKGKTWSGHAWGNMKTRGTKGIKWFRRLAKGKKKDKEAENIE